MIWVRLGAGTVDCPVWHLWHSGCVYLVTGGQEQPLAGAATATRALVVVRSKDRQGDRLVQWHATVERLEVGGPEWQEVVPLLQTKRLNAPDGARQRWASESIVLRLTPTGRLEPLP